MHKKWPQMIENFVQFFIPKPLDFFGIVWYNMYVSERDGATGLAKERGTRRTVATSGSAVNP
jgi:hypothetical protein